MDRLREGALDAQNFLANIGKQRVCLGRSPAWASRSNSPNGRVNASAPEQRRDWESCESQFVTLVIDFCLRRAFTGPPETTDCGTDILPHQLDCLRESRTEVFLSGTFGYAGGSLFSMSTEISRQNGQEKVYRQRYSLCIESVPKGSKWISSSPTTTVLPDFCSNLP